MRQLMHLVCLLYLQSSSLLVLSFQKVSPQFGELLVEEGSLDAPRQTAT